MSRFKKGDTVVCIDATNTERVKEGAQYTVGETNDSLRTITLEGALGRFYEDRFEKVECTCAMTEASMNACKIHGPDAPAPIETTVEEAQAAIGGNPWVPVEAALMEHPAVQRMQERIDSARQRIEAQDHTLAQQAATNRRLNDEVVVARQRTAAAEQNLDILQKHVQGLTNALHTFADNLEDAGDTEAAQEIDKFLLDFNLKPRKTKFEIIFTAPMQYRVEGWWRTETDARLAFGSGEIQWSEGDYESLADDEDPTIKVVAKMEDQS